MRWQCSVHPGLGRAMLHCQVLSFLGAADYPRGRIYWEIAPWLALRGLVAVLVRILPLDLPISSLYAEQISAMIGLDFSML